MMFCEYDWTFDCYRFRFGDTFTDIGGHRSAANEDERDWILAAHGLKLGRKTDSRTWKIEADTA